MSWLPLFHDMGLIGFVVGPLFTNIPCRLPADGELRPRAAPLARQDPPAPRDDHLRAELRLRARRQAPEGQGRRGARSLVPAHRGLRRRAHPGARRCATSPSGSRPAGFDPRAFLPSYGMAEATLAITFVPLGRDATDASIRGIQTGERSARRRAQELVDCGRPFPGHELAIVDEAGSRLGERQVGQIVTRGPSVTPGYFQEPELTAQTFKTLPATRTARRGSTRRPRVPRGRPPLRLRAREGHHHRPRPQLLPERHRVGR